MSRRPHSVSPCQSRGTGTSHASVSQARRCCTGVQTSPTLNAFRSSSSLKICSANPVMGRYSMVLAAFLDVPRYRFVLHSGHFVASLNSHLLKPRCTQHGKCTSMGPSLHGQQSVPEDAGFTIWVGAYIVAIHLWPVLITDTFLQLLVCHAAELLL